MMLIRIYIQNTYIFYDNETNFNCFLRNIIHIINIHI